MARSNKLITFSNDQLHLSDCRDTGAHLPLQCHPSIYMWSCLFVCICVGGLFPHVYNGIFIKWILPGLYLLFPYLPWLTRVAWAAKLFCIVRPGGRNPHQCLPRALLSQPGSEMGIYINSINSFCLVHRGRARAGINHSSDHLYSTGTRQDPGEILLVAIWPAFRTNGI